MDIEQELRAELANISGLADRVYPLVAPEGTVPPYATYHLIKADRIKTLNGYGGSKYATYQIDIADDAYSGSKALRESVLARFENFTGSIGGGGPYIESTKILAEFEKYEQESSLYHGMIECQFFYSE